MEIYGLGSEAKGVCQGSLCSLRSLVFAFSCRVCSSVIFFCLTGSVLSVLNVGFGRNFEWEERSGEKG